MISHFRAAACAAVLICIFSSNALAQFETSGRSHWGLRMMNYRPSSSAFSGLQSDWLCPAIDYNLKFDDKDRPTQIISYAWFSQSIYSTSAKLQPLTFTIIRHSSKGDEMKGWYKGIGLGLYKCQYNTIDYVNGGWANSSSTNIGVCLLGGYDFSETWFAEVRYDMAGSVSNPAAGNVSFNGIALSVGTHVVF